jgi:hypothetical protein
VVIAFDNFEKLLTPGEGEKDILEEEIEEIMLEPIAEEEEDLNTIKDPYGKN